MTTRPHERTFAIGDIHGDLAQLDQMLDLLPSLSAHDTLVFMGDYVDRGPDSRGVVERLMALPRQTDAELVFLRGNHEDGWLRTIDGTWPEFVLPVGNGCREAMESYLGRPFENEDFEALITGSFFPEEVVAWMESLQWWYEDKFAIYVHAGLPEGPDEQFIHPSEAVGDQQKALVWTRSERFFTDHRGKPTVVGHTITDQLPPELSTYTPADPSDLWAGPSVIALDTGCGKGGFLTAVEFPAMLVYETRAQ